MRCLPIPIMFNEAIVVRLIGSKMEEDFREELVYSNAALQNPDSRLHQVLESHGYSTSRAYVLHWTPEQLEDIYVVLIDASVLVSVEIDKFEGACLPEVDEMELKDYVRGLSRMNQVRLAVAQDLASAKT